MVAAGSFGRMVVGGSSGGGEASPRGGSCATDRARSWRGFSGEIPVGSSDTDAVPPAGWHLSFLKGVVVTFLLLHAVPGETLGPVRWSGQ